jgi:DNA uptake protein ComE-like DNA-binding protein
VRQCRRAPGDEGRTAIAAPAAVTAETPGAPDTPRTPPAGPVPASAAAALANGYLDLNAADSLSLVALPGVGPATAARILAYRRHIAPPVSLDTRLV